MVSNVSSKKQGGAWRREGRQEADFLDCIRGQCCACKSGIFSHHVLSVEKVFISLEVFIINDSSKMYVK